jgi:hypothetical protein
MTASVADFNAATQRVGAFFVLGKWESGTGNWNGRQTALAWQG